MKISRKTLISALQFAFLSAVLAQSILAILFSQNIFNVFTAVVTKRYLHEWAWVASSYPGFLEHSRLYFAAAPAVLAIIAFIGLWKLNMKGFALKMASSPVSAREQSFFLAGFTSLLMMVSLVALQGNGYLWGHGMKCYFNDYGPGALLVRLVGAGLIFCVLFSLSSLQWKVSRAFSTQRTMARHGFVMLFSTVPLLFIWGSQALCSFIMGSEHLFHLWNDSLMVLGGCRGVALAFTAVFTAGGFLLGCIISLTACQETSAPPSASWEEARFLAFIILVIAVGAVMTAGLLRREYHFFTNGQALLSLEERIPAPRKVIVYGAQGRSEILRMDDRKSCFTPENMEKLKAYLTGNRHCTRYSPFAWSRLVDYGALNWDIPQALECDRQRIMNTIDNTWNVGAFLGVLRWSREEASLRQQVDFLCDEKVFAYPGALSCAAMAGLCDHYGNHGRAEQFMNLANSRPDTHVNFPAESSYYQLKRGSLERFRDRSATPGVIEGTVLHQGKPLAGVKVRIFPLSRMNPKFVKEPFDYVVKAIGYEQARMFIAPWYFINWFHNPDYCRLYEIYAVTTTDASGHYSFSGVLLDRYVLAMMLEGESAGLRPSASPGIIEVTAQKPTVTVQALELK